MDLVAVGWERNRGVNEIASRDILTAKIGEFSSYSMSQTYVTLTPQKENTNPITGHSELVQRANVAVRFNAPIVLNGSYLVSLILDKREVAHLFFLQHSECSFEEMCELFSRHRELQQQLWMLKGEKAPSFDRAMFKKVDDLELTVRTANGLKNEKIVYLGDLVQKTEADLLRTIYFGRKSLNELKNVLAERNLQLGTQLKNWPPENVERWSKLFDLADY